MTGETRKAFLKEEGKLKTSNMTKNKSRPILLLTAGLLWAGLAQSQESANASGGDATGSGGTVAYSVGQVVYTSNTSSSGTVDQGVQHAFEIYTVGIKETELIRPVKKNQRNANMG